MKRKYPLITDQIYHIFSRGVDKRDIFLDPSYYSRFISILKHSLKYNYPYSLLKRRLEKAQSPRDRQNIFRQLELKRIKPPVEVISLCLMPNHHHLTLKQLVENGITDLMRRVGGLFESTFKSVMVESDEQLIHLTRYQHINPRDSGLNTAEGLVNYPWSSLSTYLGEKRFPFVKPEVVLSHFKNPQSYLEFVLAEIDEFEPLRLHEVAVDDDFGWFSRFRTLEKEQKEQLRNRYLETLS